MREKMPGLVLATAQVDTTGQVTDVTIQASSDPVFNQAAIEAAKAHRFAPAQANGVAITSQTRLSFEFNDSQQPPSSTENPGKVKPVAPIGKTSPGNPYAGKPFTMNGGIKNGKMAFIIGMKTDRYDCELTISKTDRQLLAKDLQGNIVFQGPVNTLEQHKPLNQDLRFLLERLNQGVVIQGQ